MTRLPEPIRSGIPWIVHHGPGSQLIAEQIAQRVAVTVFSAKESAGLDRHRCLYLFDAAVKRPKWAMRNQSICNKQAFPYSVEIHDARYSRAIVNQLVADYFTQFVRNLRRWGYPWGAGPVQPHNVPSTPAGVEASLLFRRFGLLRQGDLAPAVSWMEQETPSTLFAMVCPDYSFSKDSRNQALRYDGRNVVGCGVGLVALRTIAFLREFQQVAKQTRRSPTLLIGIADYEDTAENLARLGETEASFAHKVQGSIQAIGDAFASSGVPATVVGLRAFFGPDAWRHAWEQSHEAIRRSMLEMPLAERMRVVSGRRKLYARWYPGISLEESQARLERQGTEYTTCGHLLASKVVRPLVLGTNSIDMSFFYRLRAPTLPVVYVSQAYD